MFSAAKKAMEKAKAKEEELKEKHADKIEAAKDKKDGAKEKMGSGLEAAKEKTGAAKEGISEKHGDKFDAMKEKTGGAKEKMGAGLESTKDKIDERREASGDGPGMGEKFSAGLGAAKDKASGAVSSVRKNMNPPRTEREKGIIADHIYVICDTCDARMGPIKESKFNGMFKKTKTAATAGGMLTGNPKMVIGGALMGKNALADKVVGGGKGGKNIKEQAGNFMAQCNKCGKWNCPNCINEEVGFCPNCR